MNKKPKLTKTELLAASRKKALVLQRKLSDINERQEKFMNSFESESKINQFRANRVANDKNRWKTFKKLTDEENRAYKEYKTHMQKEFKRDIEKSSVHYSDRKYKKGFADREYVMDMYKLKLKNLA
ncbi:MAG: hypothetical protein IK117_10175 [Bacteroidales bacterium]|nr:hypothetical protein [Bacteroidales bacterium]